MASIVRWDPFREITSLRDEMNRLFSRSIGETQGGATWTPAIDVFDTKDAIVLKAELPGMSPDDIDIELDDNVLTVKGERRFEDKVEDGRYYRLERAYGQFQRSLQLPTGVDAAGITAGFDKGVLEVRVPKADEVKPRKIAVGPAAANGTDA